MPESRLSRVEALVLKTFDLGEADRILTILTPSRGKLRVSAKGVRRTKSRMSGHLDLFTRSSLLVARGRQMDIVTQADGLDAFRPIREDLWRSTYAHYVAELLDGFTVEEVPNYPVYAFALRTFSRLAHSQNPRLVVRGFELALMGMMGYQPQLFRCLGCNESIQPGENRFNASRGGVLCPTCGRLDTVSVPIGNAALKLMRNLQAREESVLELSQVDPEVEREVEMRLRDYIGLRLERMPRAVAFLERLRSESATA